MLSYRHAFHAGNHADVFKHLTLLACLRHFCRKDKSFLYADSHAGAGAYQLISGYAAQNREWADGIARLWDGAAALPLQSAPQSAPQSALQRAPQRATEMCRTAERVAAGPDCPGAISDYLAVLDRLTAELGPGNFPGSPVLAAAILRSQDRAVFWELHGSDHTLLADHFRYDRRVEVRLADGFAGLRAVLPPSSRRGLILIDPPYELASDYRQVLETVHDGLKRFATGTYMVWYPLLDRSEARLLPTELAAIATPIVKDAWLCVELRVRSLVAGERGMAGSGLYIINPPWTLRTDLLAALPRLVEAFGRGAGAGWTLEQGAD
jgi:23S rRNA (adenine2030-N6)-methyltransferase